MKRKYRPQIPLSHKSAYTVYNMLIPVDRKRKELFGSYTYKSNMKKKLITANFYAFS